MYKSDRNCVQKYEWIFRSF